LLPEAELQLSPRRGRGRPRKYLLLTAVIDAAVTDAMIDIGASIGDIADIADIADIVDIADIIDIAIYL